MASNQKKGKQGKLKTVRDKIRHIASGLKLYYDFADNFYAEIKSTKGRVVLSDISSFEFKNWFFDEFDNKFKEFISDVNLRHARTHVSNQARKRGKKINPDLRFNYVNGHNFIDMNRNDGKYICVSNGKWSIENNSHTIFRRDTNLRSLPMPIHGGDPKAIFKYINVTSPQQEMLLLACLCCIPLSNIQRPIINLEGPPDSGKTTTGQILKRVFDPCVVDKTTLGSNLDNMILSMVHDAVPLIDNISSIPQSISDTFCKAITGDGYKKRRHYTDDEMYSKAYRRPLIITGISSSSRKADFLSRCVTIKLKKINIAERLLETEIDEALNKDMKYILGGCLDMIVESKRLYPQLKDEIKELPRLGEFALIGAGIAEVLGYGKRNFMKAVFEMQDSMFSRNGSTIDPLVKYIQDFVENGNELKGTPTQALDTLKKVYPEIDYSPQLFGRRLNEHKETLNLLNIDSTSKNSNSGSRKIWIRKRIPVVGNA